MMPRSSFHLQLAVFALVSAAFAGIYLPQPVLPILQKEFQVGLVTASLSISAMISGIALANLPFGYLADRFPIQPIILTGAACIAVGGLVCALTIDIRLFIFARFFQGLFVPALTTCMAAYLAKTLPAERLNVVMGAYVSATVLGGMGGRLIGGFIHPPAHWRLAFVTVSILVLVAAVAALRLLPKNLAGTGIPESSPGFWQLLRPLPLLGIYLCAASSFALFSSIFNYLPYRLSTAPFELSTQQITLLYLVYIMGIFTGPAAGEISNRFGTGTTLMSGSALLGLAMICLMRTSLFWIITGLLCLCTGFFCIHSSAVGTLNRKLSIGQGRANAIYVLFYYAGGWIGITLSGWIYQQLGWPVMIIACGGLLIFPVAAGIGELYQEKNMSEANEIYTHQKKEKINGNFTF